jgi:hypothetical protein
LIWSLRIKRTKEFNTWEILRNEEDPIYINEVLINHLQNDSKIAIEQIPSEMLDDGLIHRDELQDLGFTDKRWVGIVRYFLNEYYLRIGQGAIPNKDEHARFF